MAIASELLEQVTSLTDVLGADVESTRLPEVISGLDGDDVLRVLRSADVLVRTAERVRIAASGVVTARSARDAGHEGLAQSRGHRNSVALIQDLTGSTRAEAAKNVRIGTALMERRTVGADASGDTERAPQTEEQEAQPKERVWHAPLSDALMSGSLSSAQHDAILRGLGEPPGLSDPLRFVHGAQYPEGEAPEVKRREAIERWSLAAEHLAHAAEQCTAEELARQARTIRDQLDPEGAERRFRERFENRSFRLWTDAAGQRRGSFAFDDEGGAWAQSILGAALRPRRGGPRFVDSLEKEKATNLADDPRTNDQLAYDLMLDVLRAGALADAVAVFGTRQAGVRLVRVVDPAGTAAATAHTEDELIALPGTIADQHACDTSTTACTVDRSGNPLDVGREQRLYTSKQRIALAIRDGGCRWHGCDRPASYCEAHHIDPWSRGGTTDIDRGILLCRYHHMALHNGGWAITRDGTADFVLHPPGEKAPIPLPPKLALKYAWGIDPPDRRYRPAA